MSKIEVNTVAPQCGTTLTLGESGDTVQLGSGASQSGFGRSGSVNWDTTAKTAGFTGVNGNGYFINTTSGSITVNLPASPSAGDIMAVKDYTGTAGTNRIIVGRNGSNIRSAASDFNISKNNAGATFVYVDASEGWQAFVDGSDSDAQATFIQATGGTVTTVCTDFKVHTFTGPGTFCVTQAGCVGINDQVDYLVVAGGASGSMGNDAGSAGSGAGGVRFSASTWCAPSPVSPRAGSVVTVTQTAFPITVGGGGAGIATGPTGGGGAAENARAGASGSNSIFSSITSAGGGGGAGYQGTSCAPANGVAGGSGGGAGTDGSPIGGGAGNTPPTTPSQGFPGGNGVAPPAGPDYPGGGGGGAGGAGGNAGPGGSANGGAGGVGLQVNIDGNDYYYGGGGGSSSWTGPNAAGNGGLGGGGGGSNDTGTVGAGGGSARTTGSPGGVAGVSNGGAGGDNTGGGGGAANANISNASGAGGSGIVIIRYRFQ